MNYPEKLVVGDNAFDVVYDVAYGCGSSVRIKDRKVAIRLSRYSFGGARDRTVKKFLIWAEKRLKNVSLSSAFIPKYVDGATICTHNKSYFLRVIHEERGRVSSRLIDGSIEVRIPVGGDVDLELLVDRVIIKDQLDYLQEVLDDLNLAHFRVEYNSCRFKRTSGRFGSCSSKKNINISFRLLFAPRDVFKYVCVHELAHLVEFNHSKRFWEVVSEAMSEYKVHEKWLKDNGFMLG